MRKKRIDGEKSIRVRVNKKLYEFLKTVSQDLGVSMSEVVRSVVQMFFMGYFLKKPDYRISFEEMKKEFLKRYGK